MKVSVADQGGGIDPQDLDKIFDPYFTTKQQGSGLGLASCYSIIKKHDGTIKATSKSGKGATFTITLPAATESNTAKIVEAAEEIVAETTTAKILVLDDEPLVQQISGAMLEEMGHQVDYAAKGEEALAKYQSVGETDGYDIVICDLTIPGGMGGQKVAEEILKLDPLAKLIVSSGYATDPIMANYADYGFCNRVAKPYQFSDLQKAIQKALRG